MDAVGNSKLRQGPAAAGCGHRTWGEPGSVSEYSRRLGVFVGTGLAPSLLAGRCGGRRGEPRLYGNSGMLTKERAADIFDRVRHFSSADEVEAIFTGSRFALTRFANNTIHQNVEEENSVVSIRTNFAGRTARATTNQFDDESLQRAVAASENLALVQVSDPDLLPMPDAREADGRTGETPVAPLSGFFAPSSRFFEQTAAITPADRAEVVRGIVSAAGKHKLTTAGIYSNSESGEGIFNCRGLANWHQQTLAEISITMLGDDSSGWQK